MVKDNDVNYFLFSNNHSSREWSSPPYDFNDITNSEYWPNFKNNENAIDYRVVANIEKIHQGDVAFFWSVQNFSITTLGIILESPYSPELLDWLDENADLDEAFYNLSNAGIQISEEIQRGYERIIFLEDPNGTLITLISWPGIENIESKDFDIAEQLNLRIKLLGITEIVDNKLFERVHPCLVKKNTYIGNVGGVMNAVILEGKPVGESVLQGEGAGPEPTSSALMSDLMSILRGNIKYPFGIPDIKRKKPYAYNEKISSNSLYLRLEVKDKPGVLSEITKLLASNKISIERVIQIPDHKRKSASIVIITHKALENRSQNLISFLKKNNNVLKTPVLIRLF